MAEAATEPVVAQDEALDAYRRQRFRAARSVGLTKVEALRFANGQTPLRTLKKLRADGCAPATIARIVC